MVAAAAAAAGCVGFDNWQRQAIFSVETESRAWWREPSAGTRIYDLELANGDRLRTWYLAGDDPAAPTVLYLHGSRWNLNGSAFRIERWAGMGYSVLAIDYRGFGESTPMLPSEASAREDAAAALDELARLQPDPARRFVYGHSLGGAIAIDLAARDDRPAIAGLVAESTFTSVRDMLAVTRWGWIPGLKYLVTQPFDSLDKAASLTVPVLFVHGTADSVVPHAMSDLLYDAAQRAPPGLRRLVKVEGASHSGASRAGLAYEEPVQDFIRAAGAHAASASGAAAATAAATTEAGATDTGATGTSATAAASPAAARLPRKRPRRRNSSLDARRRAAPHSENGASLADSPARRSLRGRPRVCPGQRYRRLRARFIPPSLPSGEAP